MEPPMAGSTDRSGRHGWSIMGTVCALIITSE